MTVTSAGKNGRGRPRKYDYPASLTCSVTGKVVKTNPTQMKKMLEKSGKDMATFVKSYVCRSARKQVKAAVGTSVPEPTTTEVKVDAEGE